MSQSPIIQVQNLTVGYDNRPVLENLDIAVQPGEVVGVVGGSGCGKSTLLKAMIGLLRPFSGRVLIEGVDIHAAGEKELNAVRTRMGVLFQSSGLISSLTLFGNVALPLKDYTACDHDTIRRLVHLKLGLVDLAGMENLWPDELSGGMKKRAGLARAMALDPPVLFFDEPSGGLDPVTAVELDELILRINQGMGTTVVVVTHALSSIFKITNRVVMLDGQARGIIAEGDPRALRDDPPDERVRRFFRRLPRQ